MDITPAVLDSAHVFSAPQIAAIAKSVDRVRSQTGFRVQVVTTSGALSLPDAARDIATKREDVDAEVVYDSVTGDVAYAANTLQSVFVDSADNYARQTILRALRKSPKNPAEAISRSLLPVTAVTLTAIKKAKNASDEICARQCAMYARKAPLPATPAWADFGLFFVFFCVLYITRFGRLWE